MTSDPRAGSICIVIHFDEVTDESGATRLMSRVIGMADPPTGFCKDTEEVIGRNAFAIAGMLAQGFKQRLELREEAIMAAAELMGLEIEVIHDEWQQYEDALAAVSRKPEVES